jgi:hypothetical protein
MKYQIGAYLSAVAFSGVLTFVGHGFYKMVKEMIYPPKYQPSGLSDLEKQVIKECQEGKMVLHEAKKILGIKEAEPGD